MASNSLGRVLYNYTAGHFDELSIRFNQIVTIVSEDTGAEGWWEVQLQGKRGKIPANYVEVLTDLCGMHHTYNALCVFVPVALLLVMGSSGGGGDVMAIHCDTRE
jgi:hypothetical protein